MKRPIGIDLFAGAGGLSLGFEQAGFDVVAAVESDPVHCAVHKFNFPATRIVPRSARRITGDDIRRMAGIGDREVDCVFGGPPCQGFSLIGRRALDDPRNGLVRDFVRLVAELDARTFVFENVKGLTVGRHRQILDGLIGEFAAAGYAVNTPWRVLNAANYGVPQRRERVILFGARKDLPPPDYPAPLTGIRGGTGKGNDRPPGPSCADALADLPDAEGYEALMSSDVLTTPVYGAPSPYAAALRCVTHGAWHAGYPRRWDPGLLTSSARTRHTAASRSRFAATDPGSIEPVSRFYRLPAEGVANTLRAGTDRTRGSFSSPRPIHYRHDRCVTVREMARLHGFPDWFRFHVTKWHGARQVGNAVPPPLARALAESVLRSIGAEPIRPEKEIDLGDPMLLRLNLSRASQYFATVV